MTIRNTLSLLTTFAALALTADVAHAREYREVTNTQGTCSSTAIYDQDDNYVGCSAFDYDGTFYFMQHEENECLGYCTPALVGPFDDLPEAEILELLDPVCPLDSGDGTSWGRVFWFSIKDLDAAVAALTEAGVEGFKVIE